jgi:hypothetical protein
MSEAHPEERLAERLRGADLAAMAAAAGGALSQAGEIGLEVWGEPLLVTLVCHSEAQPENLGATPSLDIKRPPGDSRRVPGVARLLLHYLARADGTPPAGEWVALHDLPEGTFYHKAYQGYSGNKLARAFGNEVAAFAQAAAAAGGEPLALADAAFAFRALPRVPLAALYWAGEDEIPPKCSILFDASAPHYLPTDVLASLGGSLPDRIIRHRR